MARLRGRLGKPPHVKRVAGGRGRDLAGNAPVVRVAVGVALNGLPPSETSRKSLEPDRRMRRFGFGDSPHSFLLGRTVNLNLSVVVIPSQPVAGRRAGKRWGRVLRKWF